MSKLRISSGLFTLCIWFVCALPASAQTIDDFSATDAGAQPEISIAWNAVSNTATTLTDDPGILGTERDIEAFRNADAGSGSLDVSVTATGLEQLVVDQGSGIQGTVEVVWDGNDSDATATDPDGFTPGEDLTGAGLYDRIRLDIAASDLGVDVTITVTEDGSAGVDSASLQLTAPAGASTLDYPFSDFVAAGGFVIGDFANAGSISLLIEPPVAGDFTLDVISLAGPARDYGDADPNGGGDPNYPTLFAEDGARHILGTSVYLGACVDAEGDGQVGSGVFTDDDNTAGAIVFGTCAGSDDEDGVLLTTAPLGGPGATETWFITGGAGCGSLLCNLNGWIDFNDDGDWIDAGEQIFTNVAISSGPNFPGTTNPASIVNGMAHARFRVCSTAATVGCATPTGESSDGEVEDYSFGSVPVALQSFSIE